MNKIVGSYLLLMLPALLNGQNLRKIDSLKSRLPTASVENRYQLLNELAWEYRFAFPDSTIIFGEKAYVLATQLHLSADLARALNYQGVAYNYKGDRLKAYDLYSKALTISTSQNDSIQIAHSNNNIGRLFFEQGLMAKSY